jgi:hypothetical protein
MSLYKRILFALAFAQKPVQVIGWAFLFYLSAIRRMMRRFKGTSICNTVKSTPRRTRNTVSICLKTSWSSCSGIRVLAITDAEKSVMEGVVDSDELLGDLGRRQHKINHAGFVPRFWACSQRRPKPSSCAKVSTPVRFDDLHPHCTIMQSEPDRIQYRLA